MISIRTKWLDEKILSAVYDTVNPARQLLILGAGYDTRGFRLDLWKDCEEFTVIEVDQPEVQENKLKKMSWLSNRGDEDGDRVADRMGTTKVQFLSVDFNTDDLGQKLVTHEGFKTNDCSVITMEGLTQYIPKESTADTLRKLKNLVGPGSTLLITYVDQKCMGDTETLSKQHQLIRSLSIKVGEPWISGWSKEDFATFMNDLGYKVVSDTTQEDYNETYLKDVGRQLEKKDLLNMERFVLAKVA